MAIRIDYEFKGMMVEKAYAKIEHIHGSAKDGWRGHFEVYNVAKDGTKYQLEGFGVEAPFVDGVSPYEALYAVATEKYNGTKDQE